MESSKTLSRTEQWLFCLATGFSVAAVVYQQSMTEAIAAGFQVPAGSLSRLSVATQLGYGLGLVLGLPLGDLIAPRRLVPGVVGALGLVVIAESAAPSLDVLTVLCLLAGLLSIGGQLLIAYCAKAFAPEQRNRVVGGMMSALFGGLLCARVLSGWGAEHIGWRHVYLLAGGLTLLWAVGLACVLGPVSMGSPPRYGQMLRRQLGLWRGYPELRRLALVAACFFAASNGIWANVISLAHATLNWSAGQTGLLACTSIVALRAPQLARRLQQHLHWTGVIALFGAVLAAVSLAGFAIGTHVLMIVVFFIGCDLCIRSVHVISQGRVLGLDPAAASRLSSLFMTVFFTGAALGSWLGGIVARHYGWPGMFLFPLLCAGTGVALLRLRSGEVRFSPA
ncbi:MFS transporter [Burkholderia plantarii]|uniref:MFS general substrate transporter n=1 Tax=Burkholderia plantarii TaxID=41899 RepID=A0A0B6S1F9_BURPL|nr:MFS transporter [Burkholderia plantarii]AJK49488.1 MFS general substrate transporter [Burkholderia plantarii]WLE62741.1 MFS transporter [Burkholderia plantarii]